MGRELPHDFEAAFIELGPFHVRDHHQASYTTVNRWLDEAGRERLLKLRAEHVAKTYPRWGETRSRPYRDCPRDFDGAFVQLGLKGCVRRYRAGWRTVHRWLNERGRERLEMARARYLGKRLSVLDVGRALSAAYPVERANLPVAAKTKIG